MRIYEMIIKEKMPRSSIKQAISEFQKLSLSKWGKCKPFLVKMSSICTRIKVIVISIQQL